MRGVAFEHISTSPSEIALPLHLTQSCSVAGTLGKLAIVLPTAALLLVPFALIGDHLIASPGSVSMLAERPASVLQIALGLLLWGALFGLPLRQLLKGLGRSRVVRIADGRVHVTERTLAGERSWIEPLRNYEGLAHHVRTTASMPRHEMILVHGDRERSVLVAVAERFSPEDVERARGLLDQSEIPSSGLYRLPAQALWQTPLRNPLGAVIAAARA